MDLVVLVGSALGLLATWIALSCLIMILRDRFSRDGKTESDPRLLSEFRLGGHAGRHMRSFHP